MGLCHDATYRLAPATIAHKSLKKISSIFIKPSNLFPCTQELCKTRSVLTKRCMYPHLLAIKPEAGTCTILRNHLSFLKAADT